jgi:hypothetical protein
MLPLSTAQLPVARQAPLSNARARPRLGPACRSPQLALFRLALFPASLAWPSPLPHARPALAQLASPHLSPARPRANSSDWK